MRIHPFPPVVYKTGHSVKIAPPYDVITQDDKKRLLSLDPHNIVRIILGRTGPAEPYARAGRLFETWKREGQLVSLKKEGIFLLRQKYEGGERTGFLFSLELNSKTPGEVLPHERTYRKFREDRYLLIKTLGAEFSPVFLLYRGAGPEGKLKSEPLFSYRMPEHSGEVRGIFDREEIAKVQAFFSKKRLYIADGHHRFAVARRLFMENPRWKRVYVFAASLEGETINPTHLVISSKYWPLIENLFVWGAFPSFDVSLVRDGMIVRGRVKRKGELAVDLIDKMKKKLSPEEIFYTHRREEVPVRAVKGKLGLLLPPLDKKIFVRRVESGRVFPQKTTYFFPKIPSGILIHPLE